MAHVPPPSWLAAHLAAQRAPQQGPQAPAGGPEPSAPAPAPQEQGAAAPAAPLRLAGGKFAPGQSGNPAGKPKGLPDRRTEMKRLMVDGGEAVVKVVIDAALSGSLDACAMVLARIAPPARHEGRRVSFSFDLSATLTQQAQQVVDAVANGELSVEEGHLLVQCLSNAAGLRAVDEMEQRIRQLEGKAQKAAHSYGAGMHVQDVDEKGNLQ